MTNQARWITDVKTFCVCVGSFTTNHVVPPFVLEHFGCDVHRDSLTIYDESRWTRVWVRDSEGIHPQFRCTMASQSHPVCPAKVSDRWW